MIKAFLFDIIIGAEDTVNLKPDPAPLLLACDSLNVSAADAVMIGDSYFDIMAGINAGTKTIRVLTGFHLDRVKEPAPDMVIEDIIGVLRFNK